MRIFRSFWVQSRQMCVSRNLPISARLSSLLVYSFHSSLFRSFVFLCHQLYHLFHFRLRIFSCFFLVSLAKGLSVFFIFLKNQLFISFILSIVFLVYISFFSTLIFISFLLLTLGFVCSSLPNSGASEPLLPGAVSAPTQVLSPLCS